MGSQAGVGRDSSPLPAPAQSVNEPKHRPSSSFVAITAVPEPSTLVLAALGTAFAAWAGRRTRPRNRLAAPAVGRRDWTERLAPE